MQQIVFSWTIPKKRRISDGFDTVRKVGGNLSRTRKKFLEIKLKFKSDTVYKDLNTITLKYGDHYKNWNYAKIIKIEKDFII